MASPDGRYQLVYNGEIYNHSRLRTELEKGGLAPFWRGHSDTEVLLAGVLAWGLEQTLARCTGMFALALWDTKDRILHLARDRVGEKPLYYGWQSSGGERAFLFASELKALKVHPAFAGIINRDAISLYLRHNYIPAPHSIYTGISKLTPGTILSVRDDGAEPRESVYWSALDVAKSGPENAFAGSAVEAVDELDRLLRASIADQMVADVPIGVFLSGGIDSSTITALMQAQASGPVRSFTIGFGEKNFDEARHAALVAKHLGTDHSELYVDARTALDVIPQLPTIYDEPFADSSQIPTFLVSKLARDHVTVALSGDGGDELFGGYNRYSLTRRTWGKLSKVPSELRTIVGGAMRAIPVDAWNSLAAVTGRFVPPRLRLANTGDKLHKAAGVLGSRDIDALYLGLVSHWANPDAVVRDATEPKTMLRGSAPDLRGLTDVERMMALDTVSYLPGDILTKVDRASMAVSLESRIPMLDHRIVEFAWRLPMDMKIRNGVAKWVLRQVLYRYVPEALVERPKTGFGVPLSEWLRGPLRDWAEALLQEDRLRREGIFDPGPIRAKWTEHVSRRRDWSYLIWDILMFQAWLESQ